jgi:fumarate reductase subunit C
MREYDRDKDRVGISLNTLRRMLLVALGWAVFHGQLQFNVLVNESSGIPPVWFLLVFVMALLASSLLEEFEQALKTWLTSIVFSVIIVLLLITLPIAFGMLASEFTPLIIMGTIQPMATSLILTAPINLLGCFLGQVMRNHLI